jgi:hypothetical protein
METKPETNTNTKPKTKTLALIIRSHGSIPLTYKPNAKLEEIVKLIDYKNQYNIQNIDDITLSHLGGVCFGDPHIGEFMKEVNKLQYTDTADKINKTFFNIDEKLKPAVNKIFGNSFQPEHKNNINLALEKHYTKYDQNSGVFIFSYDNLTPFEIASLQQSLTGINNYLLQHPNNIIKKSDILTEVSSAVSSNNKVNLTIIDLTCSAYFDENRFPLTEEIVNWINAVLNHNNFHGGVKSKTLRETKVSPHTPSLNKKTRKTRKTRKTKTKSNGRKKRVIL